MKSVCVYCSSSDAISPAFFEVANELGAEIARRNLALIYGGGSIGLMGAVARSVHASGGYVVGVLPEFMKNKGVDYSQADELIWTADMRQRKATMETRADAFIGLPGDFGTLEEMLEIITLKQLGVHTKPVVFVNTGGFYEGLNDVFEHMYENSFIKPQYRELYYFAPDVAAALKYLDNYKPAVRQVKWF